MNVRYTLKELDDLAVREIGFCVGIYWKSATGSCVPPGMISARCRLAYVLFSGSNPAGRFHALLNRQRVACLPYDHIRFVRVEHRGRTIIGAAVVAVMTPDSADATGFLRAPAHTAQPGYHRYFRERELHANRAPAWWDEPEPDAGLFTDRFAREPEDERAGFSERDDDLEAILDRLEAAYDAKLWWYGAPGRVTKYPPKLGSVHELFAYARKQELTPEEVARRNRERQSDQWLSEQHARERTRQHALDADQAEVAAALHTPRPGRAHAEDQNWLATEATIRARRGMQRLARDAAPRPRRPRTA